MTTIPMNEEHIEARQIEINNKLAEYKATLPQHKQDAMDKIMEAVALCKENDVPILLFAKFMPQGFHQWN
jgi:hypothetical protein